MAMKLLRFICFQILIVIIAVTMTYAESAEAIRSKDYYIVVTGSGTSRDDAIKIALREAVERAIGVFVYSTTSVEKFQLVKDEILTATRGMVQNYDILKEEQSDKIYFLTLKVLVKADEIKEKIGRSQKAITYDNALKDYSLIESRKEKIQKYIEVLKAINDRPLMERYSIDYTGYEIVNVSLKQTKVKLKARIAMNPFFWDTYSKIIDVISDDCSQEDSVKLCTFLYDNHPKSTYQGKKYCVNTDVYPYLLHRTPVDLQFFLKKQKKGFFGSSKDLEKYTRFIGALDENLLTYQPFMYIHAGMFQSLLRQKYIKSECFAEGNLRYANRRDDCYMFNKAAIRQMNSMSGFLTVPSARPKGECELPRAAFLQYLHMLDANGIEIETEFIFYNEEDIKELPSVKVNIGFADFVYFEVYPPQSKYRDNCKPMGDRGKCVILVK